MCFYRACCNDAKNCFGITGSASWVYCPWCGQKLEPLKPAESDTKPKADVLIGFKYCEKVVAGRQCVLPLDHEGDCLFECDDPNCPGYTWPASKERPHPANTCSFEKK